MDAVARSRRASQRENSVQQPLLTITFKFATLYVEHMLDKQSLKQNSHICIYIAVCIYIAFNTNSSLFTASCLGRSLFTARPRRWVPQALYRHKPPLTRWWLVGDLWHSECQKPPQALYIAIERPWHARHEQESWHRLLTRHYTT
jgi:hypothetical protein